MRNATLVTVCLAAITACFRPGPVPGDAAGEPRSRVVGATTRPALPHATPLNANAAGSPVLLARVGDREVVYLADADDGVVRALDAETLVEISSLTVGGAPAELIMSRGGILYASIRDRNEVIAIEGAGMEGDPMRVTRRAETPAEPIGIALVPDESMLLVASGWGHALTGFSAAALTKTFENDLGREPRAVVVSSDGKRAFVSHAIGSDLDVVELEDEKRARRLSMKVTESLSEGRFFLGDFQLQAGQAFALARSSLPEGRIFAPHARIRPTLVRTEEAASGYGSPDFGPTEEFNVAVLDEDTGAMLPGSLASSGGIACVLPRAAASTRSGELLVTCLGTHEVVAMDAAALNPHEAVTRRWSVPAGPIGIALDEPGTRALVWSAFAHALTWIALPRVGAVALCSVTLPRMKPASPAIVRGRELFHSSGAEISGDGRACASCHPDGRDDGLVWSTPDGPRNPPMLAGRLDHAAPYGWLGNSIDVAHHVKKTFARLGGKGLATDDRDALVAYVRSMAAPPVSPAADPALAAEGERIFDSESAGCASCHGDRGQAPDTLTHNVRSWAPGDVRGIFDTPSLRFVGGTAPYFHDARYKTLHALLTHVDGTMGHTAHLSPHELGALEAYLRTL